METISIFVLGQWFFGAFAVALALFTPFAVRELQRRRLAWVCGGLLFASWIGLLVSLAYVWSKGGAVYEMDASKVLREKEQRLAELAAEVNKLRSGEPGKNLLDENRRLLEAKTKADSEVEQLRSQVASLQARLDEFRRQKILEPSPGVGPSAPPKVARTPHVSVEAPKYQDLPKFRVELTRLHVGSGNEVDVFLTYFNKTQEELKFMLIGAAMGRTFVSDNVGNRYKYKSSSGLSGDMYESYMRGTPMVLAPGTRATASFGFVASPRESKGTLFSFSSEQALVSPTVDKYLSWKTARIENQFNLTILDIEPR